MNLKLLKLQIIASGFLSLVLAAEWGYALLAERQLQQSLQYAKDDSDTSVELPTISELYAEEYNELVERPLFIEGRKPIVEAAAADKVQNVEIGQIDDWLLIGVFSKGERPMALFAKKNEAKKYLKIGSEQMISGWQLKEIQADRVILQQAEQQKSVLLRKPRPESKLPLPVPGRTVPPKPPAQPTNINPENANDDSETN
jgi:hypothetical protein